MTGLCFRLVQPPDFALDVSRILPENMVGIPVDEIRRMRLVHGRRRVMLGDLFEIDESAEDGLAFYGATDKLHSLGSGMSQGQIRVHGNVGDKLGACMTSGHIHVLGNAGDYVGSGMRGGTIDIKGNSGDFTGGALPQKPLGMRDGVICVGKSVGLRAGEYMRRGLLVVNGDAGPYCGSNLIAGTVIVTGHAAQGIGYGMRRGTILLGHEPQEIPVTFNKCGTQPLTFLALLLRHLRTVNRKAHSRLRSIREVRRLTGDISYGGQGEILIASQ